MQGLSSLKIWLLSVLAEVLLLGIFCVLYPIAIWILACRRSRWRRSSRNLWLSAIVTIMFFCAGTYPALDLRFLLVAFVDRSVTAGGPLAYFQQPRNDPSLYVSAVIFAFLTLLGDGFMTYRVYVVWDRKLVSLVLPALLLSGGIVTTGLVAKTLLQGDATTTLDVVFVPGGRLPLIAYFVVTLLTNLCTTLLLLGRLWWHEKRTTRYLSQDAHCSVSWRVMKTIMQSQAVYSTWVIFNLVAYLTHSELVLITNATLPPLLGISFTLIIIRIGLSEAIGTANHEYSANTDDTELTNRGRRAASPIAVNVFTAERSESKASGIAALDHTMSPSAMTCALGGLKAHSNVDLAK